MLNPNQIREIIVLRQAGYSLSAICERVDAGATAVKKVLRDSKVTKGAATAALIEEARKRLLSDQALTDSLKQTIAEMIADDLSTVRRLRENILLTLEKLEECSDVTPTGRARTLAALATTATVTQSIYRKALRVSHLEQSAPASELQPLPIYFMTPEDEAAVRAATNSDEFGIHDAGFDNDTDDSDIISEV